MTFNQTKHERLFFRLNKKVYRHIQKVLDATGENQKDFNILIEYKQPDMNIEKLQFSTDFDISLGYIKKPSAFLNGNLFCLSFNQGNEINSFYTPLKYLLDNENDEILNNEARYVYSYTLLINKNTKIKPVNNDVNIPEDIQPYLYIGITKQPWQNRFSYHRLNMTENPQRLLYQALNGDFGRIREKKLFIEKAGLTENEALDIEEKEVNKRSLCLLFSNGLNMIPGGNAGLEMFTNKKVS